MIGTRNSRLLILSVIFTATNFTHGSSWATTAYWSRIPVSANTPTVPVKGHSAVYDPNSGSLLVFGGSLDDTTRSGSLWLLSLDCDASAWVEVDTDPDASTGTRPDREGGSHGRIRCNPKPPHPVWRRVQRGILGHGLGAHSRPKRTRVGCPQPRGQRQTVPTRGAFGCDRCPIQPA